MELAKGNAGLVDEHLDFFSPFFLFSKWSLPNLHKGGSTNLWMVHIGGVILDLFNLNFEAADSLALLNVQSHILTRKW